MGSTRRFISSYKKQDGRIVSGHNRNVRHKEKNDFSENVTANLSNGIRLMVGPEGQQYPAKKYYDASKVGFVDRFRRIWRFKRGMIYKTSNHINPKTGEGYLALRRIGENSRKKILEQRIHPAATLTYLTSEQDYRRANLGAARIWAVEVSKCDFRGANLDGTEWGTSTRTPTTISDSNFEGASFVGADLRQVILSGDVNMKGSNFLGAKFDGIKIGKGATLDFRDTNISKEQLDTILQKSNEYGPEFPRTVKVPSYTFQETAEKMGVDEEELAILIWAGDVEVRDQAGRIVTGEYEATKHSIPVWAAVNAAENHAA